MCVRASSLLYRVFIVGQIECTAEHYYYYGVCEQ